MDGEAAIHVPVLTDAVVSLLAPVVRRVWVDCTVGLGGHAAAVMRHAAGDAWLVALDVDPAALASAESALRAWRGRVRFVRATFREAEAVIRQAGCEVVDALFADLGVNSSQLADPRRGLSFERDGPLDMRLDPGLKTTAADLVNGLRESELADLLYVESQERHSRRIAKRICQARRAARIKSTVELARLVVQAVGGRRGRLHPATKTFLALRSAVNREGESLAGLLEAAPKLLRPGGRVGVISFHSGEDRRVKEDFRRRARSGVYRLLTKTPMVPDRSEVGANPRSRSAKFRVAERTGAAVPAAAGPVALLDPAGD